MQTKKNLPTLLVFTISLCFSVAGFAQGKTIEMSDSTGLHSYSVLNGDTVLIRYDSAYVLNKRTFKILQDNYKRVQKGDPSLKKLLDSYESLIALQDSMLKTKEAYYQQLKGSFDSLVTGSNTFLNKTDVNITAINQSLDTATGQLNHIKTLLDDSLEKLKQESKQRLKIAAKGFAAGVAVAALVFLITK